MRSIPRKSETLGNRPWRMGWPSAKARGRGGAAAGGRSPPARCRAEPGSGLVRGPGPWPSNAAAAPRPKGSALAAGNGRPWAIRRSRRGRGRAGTEIRGGGGVWRPGGGPAGPPPRPAKQKSVARGQRPRATLFQGASRPAAAPPPPSSPPTPKRQRKSQAPRSTGPGARNHGRKGRGTGPAPRAKPGPTAYGCICQAKVDTEK